MVKFCKILEAFQGCRAVCSELATAPWMQHFWPSAMLCLAGEGQVHVVSDSRRGRQDCLQRGLTSSTGRWLCYSSAFLSSALCYSDSALLPFLSPPQHFPWLMLGKYRNSIVYMHCKYPPEREHFVLLPPYTLFNLSLTVVVSEEHTDCTHMVEHCSTVLAPLLCRPGHLKGNRSSCHSKCPVPFQREPGSNCMAGYTKWIAHMQQFCEGLYSTVMGKTLYIENAGCFTLFPGTWAAKSPINWYWNNCISVDVSGITVTLWTELGLLMHLLLSF